jgi:hypothetical protein
MRAVTLIVFLILMCLVVARDADAQGVVGRVTDSTGAVLPGVTVTVENPRSHLTRVLATNENGDYRVDKLPGGRYSVTIELPGTGIALWLFYGLMLHSRPIIFSNAVVFPLAATILGFKLRHG